jgi:hypothetical protein
MTDPDPGVPKTHGSESTTLSTTQCLSVRTLMNHDLHEVEMLSRLGRRLPLEDERLGEEHPGDADQGGEQQQALDHVLTRVHVLVAFGAVLLVLLRKMSQRKKV